MTKVLITGSAGFIGSQLAYRLHKLGEEVILVDNFSYGSEDNLIFDDYSFTKEIYREDIRNTEFMENLFKENKFDMIYHFAGITPLPDCQNKPVEAIDVNVKGTGIMLDLAKRYGIKKFIFASTSAIYENNTDFPSMENNVERPSLLYPSTKYCAEQLCKAYFDAYKIPIVCLRFANVFGPHIDCLRKQPPVIAYIIREYFLGKKPTLHSDGNQKRDFVFVEDLLDLAILVRKNEEFDIVNVGTETTVTINELARLVAKTMGIKDATPNYTDAKNYWNHYPELNEKPYPINKNLMEKEVLKYTCLSNKHAYKKYGWKPKVSLEEGIKITVDYTVKLLKEKNIK